MLYVWLLILLVVIAGGIWLVFRMLPKNKVGGGTSAKDDIKTRVNLSIAVPRIKNDKSQESKDSRKEYIAPMETIFSNLAGIAEAVGERHITLEIATAGELTTFY